MDKTAAIEMETALDLEQQLQSAVKLATRLKEENATLQRDLDDTKQFAIASTERNSEMRDCWKKQIEVVEKREKELEREQAKWRQRLEERKAEIDKLERQYEALAEKVQIVPTNENVIKQLENEHRSKLLRMEEETSKWRDAYYDARQASEQLKAKCEDCIGRVEREKETNDALRKAITDLQESFVHHVERKKETDVKDCEKLVRDLRRELNKKDLALSGLQEQLKALEKERDDGVMAKDSLAALHRSEISVLMQEKEKVGSANQALERRLAASEKEILEATKGKEKLEEKLDITTKEVKRLQTCLKSAQDTHDVELAQLRCNVDRITAESTKNLSSLRRSLTDEQERSKKLEQRCNDMQERAMKHIGELAKSLEKKDDSAEQQLVARDDIVRLEHTVKRLQESQLQTNRDHDAECHRLAHTIEACHNEIRLRVMEANAVSKELNVEQSRYEQLQKELVSTDVSLKKCEQRCCLLESENKNLKIENKSLKNELESLSSQTKEMTLTATKARTEADKAKEMFIKEKQRSAAYKEKALEAHRRSLEAKEMLDSIYKKN